MNHNISNQEMEDITEIVSENSSSLRKLVTETVEKEARE